MVNRNLFLGALCFAFASVVSLYADAWAEDVGHIQMQQMTAQSDYIDALNNERDNLDHWIWPYVSAVISGANVGAIISSGSPIACHMHGVEDTDLTANLIIGYLVQTNMIGNEEATLEIAIVAAFAWAYPCGVVL